MNSLYAAFEQVLMANCNIHFYRFYIEFTMSFIVIIYTLVNKKYYEKFFDFTICSYETREKITIKNNWYD